MAKRYYKIGEMIWIKPLKQKGKVLSLDIPNLEVRVSIKVDEDTYKHSTYKFMEVDKLKNDKKVTKKYSPDEMYWMVREFHQAFNHPVQETPTMLTAERIKTRNAWVEEELVELIEAKDIVGQADAVIDAIYFLMGTLVEMGVRPYNLFRIVHQANMGKLHNIDGKLVPVYHGDNKVKKPDNWETDFAPEPRLIKEIEFQSK